MKFIFVFELAWLTDLWEKKIIYRAIKDPFRELRSQAPGEGVGGGGELGSLKKISFILSLFASFSLSSFLCSGRIVSRSRTI